MINWEEINKMGYSDLKNVASHLVRQANQRARRLRKKAQTTPDFYSPELANFEKRGKPFTTRGKSYNELKNEIKRTYQFLSAKTSTIKGAIKYQKEVSSKLNLKYNDKDYVSKFWDTVHRLNATPQFREWLSKNGFKYDDPTVIKFIQNKTDFSDVSTSLQDVIKAIEKQNADIDIYKQVQEEGEMWF